LICRSGHRYPVVDGIPILLLTETQRTHVEGTCSLQVGASGGCGPTPLPSPPLGDIDPFVQNVITATNGMLYIRMIGKLTDYPIPYLRLPPGGVSDFWKSDVTEDGGALLRPGWAVALWESTHR
jgi:hypothetical protein